MGKLRNKYENLFRPGRQVETPVEDESQESGSVASSTRNSNATTSSQVSDDPEGSTLLAFEELIAEHLKTIESRKRNGGWMRTTPDGYSKSLRDFSENITRHRVNPQTVSNGLDLAQLVVLYDDLRIHLQDVAVELRTPRSDYLAFLEGLKPRLFDFRTRFDACIDSAVASSPSIASTRESLSHSESFISRSPSPRYLYVDAASEDFNVVDKPLRFFSVGRVFETVWFESSEPRRLWTLENADWTNECPMFGGEKPHARIRQFVVVRNKLNHSLCFGLTCFGGTRSTRHRHGCAIDYVVLYPHGTEPPEPHHEEGIRRAPISLMAVDPGATTIPPSARLDCSRIHTVEHCFKVREIGRVHPESLGLLEDYLRETVM